MNATKVTQGKSVVVRDVDNGQRVHISSRIISDGDGSYVAIRFANSFTLHLDEDGIRDLRDFFHDHLGEAPKE